MDQASSDLAAARNIHGSCSRQIRTGCRERPLTSTTHHPSSPDQTTKIYTNGSHPPRPSGEGSSDLETSPLDCSARNASHMASSAVPPLLEAPFQAKTDTGESSCRDHCVDQGDGKQQSTLGSGTDPRRITQVGDSCQQTHDPEAHATRAHTSIERTELEDPPPQPR